MDRGLSCVARRPVFDCPGGGRHIRYRPNRFLSLILAKLVRVCSRNFKYMYKHKDNVNRLVGVTLIKKRSKVFARSLARLNVVDSFFFQVYKLTSN